ncbi:MAG: fatty acid CoA ligase family protein [Planctomycetota bacterium]|jgi:acyl-CoA synthetase (AMP-forming)/AMP-acid ligase II
MTETTVNIASHLPRMAELQPHTLAVAFPQGRDPQGRVSYTRYTYRQLDEQSNAIARGLRSIGIGPGVRTVLMVKPSLDFFALTFALFKVGAVMVCVDPGMGVKNLGKCLGEAEPEAFIGIPKAHLARKMLGWAKKTIRTKVVVGPHKKRGGMVCLDMLRDLGMQSSDPATTPELAPTQPEDDAAILFTSGSTGIPKGVVYTHANFDAQVRALKAAYDIQPGEVDLATFPLFALYAPALGMSAIVPDMDFTRPGRVDPRKIHEAVENFGVTNMFGSPALLNRVGRYGERHGLKLRSLKRVISAGAPVPAHVMRRMTAMLSDGVQVFTPYGATESLPVASIGSDRILTEAWAKTEEGRGVCVGPTVGDMTVRVIKITDDPIETWSDDLLAPPGQIGEICVKGPVVTREYFNRESSTRLAKIHDENDGSFWHRMGDLGYLDEDNNLWFCGRKSQRVQTPDGDMYTIPCEAVFNTHESVFRTALVGVQRNGAIEPVICVELEKGIQPPNVKELHDELLAIGAQHEHTSGIRHFLLHRSFPVDIRHNAKIGRERLSHWAEKRLK